MKKKLKFDKNNCRMHNDTVVISLQPKMFSYIVKMYENKGFDVKTSKQLCEILPYNTKINKKFAESGFPFRIVKDGKLKTNSLTYFLKEV